MMNVFIAFLTGLTTGGLSCLAIQGGLLATTLAHQVELDMQTRTRAVKSGRKFQPQIALPIALFLLAKLVAYTLVGVLLGSLGFDPGEQAAGRFARLHC